ncbi:MAG: hypothetical protein ABIA76_04605 [Candidatus Diapherotrites archaeon]
MNPRIIWLEKLARLRQEQWRKHNVSFEDALKGIQQDHEGYHGTQNAGILLLDGKTREIVFTGEKAAEWRYKREMFLHKGHLANEKYFDKKIKPIAEVVLKDFPETGHPVFTVTEMLLRCIQNTKKTSHLWGNPDGPELKLKLIPKGKEFELNAEYEFGERKETHSVALAKKQIDLMEKYITARYKLSGVEIGTGIDEKIFDEIMHTE